MPSCSWHAGESLALGLCQEPTSGSEPRGTANEAREPWHPWDCCQILCPRSKGRAGGGGHASAHAGQIVRARGCTAQGRAPEVGAGPRPAGSPCPWPLRSSSRASRIPAQLSACWECSPGPAGPASPSVLLPSCAQAVPSRNAFLACASCDRHSHSPAVPPWGHFCASAVNMCLSVPSNEFQEHSPCEPMSLQGQGGSSGEGGGVVGSGRPAGSLRPRSL